MSASRRGQCPRALHQPRAQRGWSGLRSDTQLPSLPHQQKRPGSFVSTAGTEQTLLISPNDWSSPWWSILTPHPPFHMTHCCRGYSLSSPKPIVLLVKKQKHRMQYLKWLWWVCSQSYKHLPFPVSEGPLCSSVRGMLQHTLCPEIRDTLGGSSLKQQPLSASS